MRAWCSLKFECCSVYLYIFSVWASIKCLNLRIYPVACQFHFKMFVIQLIFVKLIVYHESFVNIIILLNCSFRRRDYNCCGLLPQSGLVLTPGQLDSAVFLTCRAYNPVLNGSVLDRTIRLDFECEFFFVLIIDSCNITVQYTFVSANSNWHWPKQVTWFVSANVSYCLQKQMKIELLCRKGLLYIYDD